MSNLINYLGMKSLVPIRSDSEKKGDSAGLIYNMKDYN